MPRLRTEGSGGGLDQVGGAAGVRMVGDKDTPCKPLDSPPVGARDEEDPGGRFLPAANGSFGSRIAVGMPIRGVPACAFFQIGSAIWDENSDQSHEPARPLPIPCGAQRWRKRPDCCDLLSSDLFPA